MAGWMMSTVVVRMTGVRRVSSAGVDGWEMVHIIMVDRRSSWAWGHRKDSTNVLGTVMGTNRLDF